MPGNFTWAQSLVIFLKISSDSLLKTIFSSCTMKGESHEQLHVFIMPLVDLCEKLESAETEDEALVLQKDILKQLNLYAQYFK